LGQKVYQRYILLSVEILALHLALGGFPGISFMAFLHIPKDEKAVFLERLICLVNEHRRPQIDTPAFCRMFDIRIGLLRVIGEMLRPSYKAWLKHI
jgi:hypothetical protein